MQIHVEDGLPALICNSCLDLARTSYKFQQQCNRSNAILQAYISRSSSIVETNSKSIETQLTVKKECHLQVCFNTNSLSSIDDREDESQEVQVKELLKDYHSLKSIAVTSERKDTDNTDDKSGELDAEKVVTTETGTKLKQSLMCTETIQKSEGCDNLLLKQCSRVNLNYYVTEASNGEKVCKKYVTLLHK